MFAVYRPSLKFKLIYCLACAFLFVCYSFISKIGEYRNSAKTKAIVVDIVSRLVVVGRPGSRGADFYPVLKFNYNDSNYIVGDYSNVTSDLAIGDSTTIVFNKNSPGSAIVYGFFRYWLSFKNLIPGILSAIVSYFIINGILKNRYNERWVKKFERTLKIEE